MFFTFSLENKVTKNSGTDEDTAHPYTCSVLAVVLLQLQLFIPDKYAKHL